MRRRSVREWADGVPPIAKSPAPRSSSMAIMTARRVRHLPVNGDGELLGIVSIGDLARASELAVIIPS